MPKITVKQIRENVVLFRCSNTGIAWVEDYTTGSGHSAHPNIDATGSVRGMKQRGHWREKDRCVRSHGFIYNIDRVSTSSDLDEIARQNCRCGGVH